MTAALSQPFSYVKINASNPLTKNLTFAFNGAQLTTNVDYFNDIKTVVSSARLVNNSVTRGYFVQNNNIGNKHTFVIQVRNFSDAPTNGGLFSSGGYSVNNGYDVQWSSGSTFSIEVWPYVPIGNVDLSASQTTTIAIVLDKAVGTATAYVNGALFSSVSCSQSPTVQPLYIGRLEFSGAYFALCDIDYIYTFDEAFDANQIRSLYSNPWQVYSAPSRFPVYFLPLGGGGVTASLTGTGVLSAAETTLASTVVSLLGVSSTLSNGNISVSTGATAALTSASAAIVSEVLQPQTLGSIAGNAAAPLFGNLGYGAFSTVSGESVQILQTSALQPQTSTPLAGSSVTPALDSVNYGVFSDLLGTPTQVLQTPADSATAAFLLGALSTMQAGSVTASTGAVTQLTGLQITSQQGSVTPASSSVVSITGESVPTISGSLASVISVILAGAESGTQSGVVSTSTTLLPQGIGISLFQGNVSVVSSDVTVALTGASLIGLQAAISAVLAASASGSVSSAFSETLSASLSKVLQGASVQTLSGDLLSAISVVVNGSSVTVFAGSVITESGAESVDWFIVEHKSNTVLVEYSRNTILANGK